MIQYEETKEKLNNEELGDIKKISQIRDAYKSKIELYKKCLENIEVLINNSQNSNTDYLSSILQKTNDGLDLFNGQVLKANLLEQEIYDIHKDKESIKEEKKSETDKIAKIIYFGKLYQEDSDKVNIIYGFENDWEQTEKLEMTKTEYGFFAEFKLGNFNNLNFCFSNELNRWDNNNFNNYQFGLKNKIYEFSDDKNYSIVIEDEKTEVKNKKEQLNKRIEEYNDNFKEFKNGFFNISLYEENTMLKYVETQMQEYINSLGGDSNICKTKDNGTLLISEIQNKVVLPYTGEEVEEILKKDGDKYENADNVINDNFVKPLSYYKDVYISRLRETYKLLTEKEDYTKIEATELAFELFGKRFLHPAIISACKNLDELDVYLDCLSKNELDDFKIFDIKYELYPVVVKENKPFMKINIFKKIIRSIKKFLSKKNRQKSMKLI